jgi:hypothetical protein
LLITEVKPESKVDSRDLIPLEAAANVLLVAEVNPVATDLTPLVAAVNPEATDLTPLEARANTALDSFDTDDIFMIYISLLKKKRYINDF